MMRIAWLTLSLLACGHSSHPVDGGLAQGAICDPQDDKCATGLKCCSEPTHMQPPSQNICVTPQTDGTCPMFP